MKRITAVLAAMLLIACLFAGCDGADGGKVSDTSNNDIPVITTDNMSDSFEDGSVSDKSESGIFDTETQSDSASTSTTNTVGM